MVGVIMYLSFAGKEIEVQRHMCTCLTKVRFELRKFGLENML